MNRESYRLMLKRKASATGSVAPNTAGGGKETVEERATFQDTNDELANQLEERFHFDSFSNNFTKL